MQYEVGKYYWVTCMEMYNQYIEQENIFVPIFNLLHKDKQFDADFFHYHLDCRFTSKKVENIFDVIDGRTKMIVQTIGKPKNFKNCSWQSIRIVQKKLKCKRVDTGILPPKSEDHKYWIWRKEMIGKSCKGKKCPHLGTTMIDVNGKLQCPLHNIIGCPEKEIIIE